jgi:hypothetical protein
MAYENTIEQVHAIDGVSFPGEVSASPETEVQVVHATGTRTPLSVFPGAATISGSAEIAAVGHGLAATLQKVLTGAEMTFDDSAALYTGYATSLSLEIPAHEVVSASIDFTAHTKAASEAPEAHAIADFYIGTNVAVTGFPVKNFASCSVSVSANVNERHSASGTARLPVHLAPGYIDVEVEFTFIEDPGIDTVAASLASIAAPTIAVPSQGGTKTLTFTFDTAQPGPGSRNPSAEDIVEYGLTYHCVGLTISETA